MLVSIINAPCWLSRLPIDRQVVCQSAEPPKDISKHRSHQSCGCDPATDVPSYFDSLRDWQDFSECLILLSMRNRQDFEGSPEFFSTEDPHIHRCTAYIRGNDAWLICGHVRLPNYDR